MCQTVWIQIRPDINVNVWPDLGESIFVKVFFMLFMSTAAFFNINFFEISFRSTINVSNSLDPDQARQ